jgi:acyl carrier protein
VAGVSDARPVVTPADVRALLTEIQGRDPGPIAPETSLAQLGVIGLVRLQLVAALEERFGIQFPGELIGAIETVESLAHYTTIKVSQGDDG